jgi:DNA-binding transcriptional LysR family regulator
VKAEIDVVLTDEYTHLPRQNRPELAAEVLMTEPMRIGLAKDDPLAADGGPVPIAALADRAWATGHVGTNHADLLERTCVELGGFRPIVRYRSNDLAVIITMVERARSVCLAPYLAISGWEGDLVARDIAEVRLLRRMVMWTRVGADVRPSVRAVMDALRESADALAARLPGLERGDPDGE